MRKSPNPGEPGLSAADTIRNPDHTGAATRLMKTKTTTDNGFTDLGRFSEPALLILISLAEGPKHGYAMADDIAALIGSRLGPGTLYGAISRLESRQLIAALQRNERRVPYQLTDEGKRILRARLASLTAVAEAGVKRLARA